MIDARDKLLECLELEKSLYRSIGYKGKLHAFLTQCEVGKIYNYIKYLRFDEYYVNKKTKNFLDIIVGAYCRMKHNKIGVQLGVSIPTNTFGKGLLIYHSQGIIVNKETRCGDNCKLHGLNCIGNNGSKVKGGCPQIGDNLDLGVGAKIIGDISLGNNITVGCNAVVCKSCVKNGVTLIGIPAKALTNIEDNLGEKGT